MVWKPRKLSEADGESDAGSVVNHHAAEIDEDNHCVIQTIQHERVHVICLIGSICCVVIAGADIRRLLLFAPFFSSRPGLLAQQA